MASQDSDGSESGGQEPWGNARIIMDFPESAHFFIAPLPECGLKAVFNLEGRLVYLCVSFRDPWQKFFQVRTKFVRIQQTSLERTFFTWVTGISMR